MVRMAFVVAVVLGSGCSYGAGDFTCTSDESCSMAGVAGRCESNGFCSFVDDTCASGRRFGASSGPVSNMCVGVTDAGGIDTPDASGPPFCDPSDPHLAACYEFEGNTRDGSGHGLDATMVNVTFVPGRVGMAMQFGPTSAADVAESPAFDVAQMTIEAWIKPSQLPPTGTRAGIVDNQNQYGFFLQDNADLQCTSARAPTNVTAGQWSHVACTFDGATARIYVDGSLVGSAALSGLGTGGTTGISIAADNPPGSGSQLVGLIDQLRFENVARTAAQLCADAGRTSCL